MMKQTDLDRELCLAVIRPDPEEVERLLAGGANPNSVGDKKFSRIAHGTPVWLAVSNAGQEISREWTNFYATVRDVFQSIPDRDHLERREKLLRIVEILIKAGSNLETQSFGGTPLRVAVYGKDLELVSLLLASGANPNAETYSPLSSLARKERMKGPLGLMGYYNTVLHEAVEKGSLTIVETLLKAGADPERTDHEGKTPLDLAREKGLTDIFGLLEKAATNRRTVEPRASI